MDPRLAHNSPTAPHPRQTRRSWELVSATALTALETLCDNATLWGTDYGVVPTKTGVNALSGKGIPERPEVHPPPPRLYTLPSPSRITPLYLPFHPRRPFQESLYVRCSPRPLQLPLPQTVTLAIPGVSFRRPRHHDADDALQRVGQAHGQHVLAPPPRGRGAS